MPLDVCTTILAVVVIAIGYYVLTMQDDINVLYKKYDKVCYFLDVVGDLKSTDGKKIKTKDFIDELLGDG